MAHLILIRIHETSVCENTRNSCFAKKVGGTVAGASEGARRSRLVAAEKRRRVLVKDKVM